MVAIFKHAVQSAACLKYGYEYRITWVQEVLLNLKPFYCALFILIHYIICVCYDY